MKHTHAHPSLTTPASPYHVGLSTRLPRFGHANVTARCDHADVADNSLLAVERLCGYIPALAAPLRVSSALVERMPVPHQVFNLRGAKAISERQPCSVRTGTARTASVNGMRASGGN
eukprot:350491-Chlamydomonas_euryale.AAC.3